MSGPADEGPERIVVRVWVPDEPGALAALASRVAGAGGNVVGLEVLERRGDAALDELLIELEGAELVDHLCGQVASAPGTTIEQVRPVPPDAAEHGLRVIDAALTILTRSRPTGALDTLVGAVRELFDADWCALVDRRAGTVLVRVGATPPVDVVLEVAAGDDGAAGRPGGVGGGLEVLTTELEEAGLTLCAGRPIPFRRRERREMEMLARVTDRTCRPARRDRVPPEWSA